MLSTVKPVLTDTRLMRTLVNYGHKVSVLSTCFARCGFKSDPEMDYTVAEFVATDRELTSVVEMATTALSLDNPMTADEYVTWDEDTPSTEELGDNWKEEFLLRHMTPDTATTTAIESD